jgi:pimeloyl-ACP methyl ester carboxylesterase
MKTAPKESPLSKATSIDGTTIAFDRSGEGPPVILVGGAFQYRSFDPRTAQLAALLAERFTVFHYDRRGRGDSGDTLPYEVDLEVEDIWALIGEAGGSAFVFGMSSGAVLALEAARRLPITKLALYEPPFFVDDTRPPLPADYHATLAGLVSAGRAGDAVAYFMTRAVNIPAETVAQLRGAPMWPGFEAVAHTLVYDATIVGDGSIPTERCASVAIPTLVVDGGASPHWMRNAATALAAALPNVGRATLPEQDHGVDPEVLAPVLVEFFAG